jgi:hypothetical protein
MTNTELAAGLRALADFYETHPEMPLAYPELNIFVGRKSEADAVRAAFGPDATETLDEPGVYPEWHSKRDFAGVTLHARSHIRNVARKTMKNMLVESWELIPEEPVAEVEAHNPLRCEDAECVACNDRAEAV